MFVQIHKVDPAKMHKHPHTHRHSLTHTFTAAQSNIDLSVAASLCLIRQ